MNLFESLGLSEPVKIAVVGAGGKTTVVFQLARQVKGKAGVTTTTHLGTDQLDLADRHFILDDDGELEPSTWLENKVSLLTGDRTPDDRMRGPSSEAMDEIVKLAGEKRVSVIVEADGARSHPIKAPGENEPVIPPWVDAVIVVIGLSAIGKTLSAKWVHRPEQFARLSAIPMDNLITLEGTVRMLLDPEGGLKGIPAGSSKIALFNQADTLTLNASDLLTLHSVHPEYDRVLVAALGKSPTSVQVIP